MKKPTKQLTKMNECHYCVHKRNVPGNTHIQCNKPDHNLEGDEHGIRNGWFIYPLLFDPVWKLERCNNFEEVEYE